MSNIITGSSSVGGGTINAFLKTKDGIPSPTYQLKEEGGIISFNGLEFRAFSEALRELISKGATTFSHKDEKGNMLLLKAQKLDDEDIHYWVGVGKDSNGFSPFPYSKWEIRGVLKQIDLMIDITERKSSEILVLRSLAAAKKK